MLNYQNILLVGASSSLGPSILKAFADSPHPFSISILDRLSSTANFPTDILVHRSDMSDVSVLEALSGVDVVVSMLPSEETVFEMKLIDWSVQAGVKRFIPSDYGLDVTNPATLRTAWPLLVKTQVTDYLKTKQSDTFTWSALIVGQFFDWGLKNGFLGFDFVNQTVKLYDGGQTVLSLSTTSLIADALVSLLLQPAETENRHVLVHSVNASQIDLLNTLERVSGSTWSIEEAKTADLVERADVLRAQGVDERAIWRVDKGAALGTILAAGWKKGAGGSFGICKRGDNGLLGLDHRTLEDLVKEVWEDVRAA